MTAKITIYESKLCGFCHAAKMLLDKKGWAYDSVVVDGRHDLREEMESRSGRTSVPQIFFDEHHVGGFDDLSELDMTDSLDSLYNGEAQD